MPNVRAVELDGELVLLDLVRGEYFGLDEVGTRAWHFFQTGRTVREVAQQLASSYDVELETVTLDLASFVRDLEAAGLLTMQT